MILPDYNTANRLHTLKIESIISILSGNEVGLVIILIFAAMMYSYIYYIHYGIIWDYFCHQPWIVSPLLSPF